MSLEVLSMSKANPIQPTIYTKARCCRPPCSAPTLPTTHPSTLSPHVLPAVQHRLSDSPLYAFLPSFTPLALLLGLLLPGLLQAGLLLRVQAVAAAAAAGAARSAGWAGRLMRAGRTVPASPPAATSARAAAPPASPRSAARSKEDAVEAVRSEMSVCVCLRARAHVPRKVPVLLQFARRPSH